MKRTTVMYTEIGCFLCCVCGWILISSTLATEYWNFSEVGGTVITTVNYYSNLWMDCLSDTTGASDCKYYPSMLALPVFLHVTRALAVASVVLGFGGSVLTLVGMKCTKIGGSELVNTRVTLAAGFTYLASGFTGLILFSLWGNKMRSEFVDPNFKPQKFELGAALFVGWGGSSLVICGGAVLCYFSCREGFISGSDNALLEADPYARPLSRGTYMTARTRGTYMFPAYSQSSTRSVPALLYSGRESKKNRRTQRAYKTWKRAPSVPINIDSYV